MAMYIKVTPRVAQVLGKEQDRVKTKDGNVLLWQADLNGISGSTIFERASAVGGVALTAQEAKAETDGVGNSAQVSTPSVYQSEDEISSIENDEEETNDGGIDNE